MKILKLPFVIFNLSKFSPVDRGLRLLRYLVVGHEEQDFRSHIFFFYLTINVCVHNSFIFREESMHQFFGLYFNGVVK